MTDNTCHVAGCHRIAVFVAYHEAHGSIPCCVLCGHEYLKQAFVLTNHIPLEIT